MSRASRTWASLALIFFLGLADTSANAYEVIYTVRKGDSLYSISARYLSSDRTWRDLMSRAKIRDPYALQVGRKITIPAPWLRRRPLEARLAAFHGNVQVTVAGRIQATQTNMTVPERSSVVTGARSFATLTLPDGSLLSVLPQSVVRITQLSTVLLSGARETVVRVDRGRTETKVAPLKKRVDVFRVTTPLAAASVRGTAFRTIADPDGQMARVEVLEGRVAVSDGKVGMLSAGEGIVSARGGLSKHAALLPAPHLKDPGRIQDGESLSFAVRPLDGATEWHGLLAADAGFVEIIDEATSKGSELVFDNPPVDGIYFLRISGVSTSGFGGMQREYAVRRIRYQFSASLDSDKRGDTSVYLFRWLPDQSGDTRFRFVLRRQGEEDSPIADLVGLTANNVEISDLPPGTYMWRVGRWSPGSVTPELKWDEERELVVARSR